MFDKVLILSASVGAGHMRAAEALERAFLERGAAREVRHVDTLEYATKLFRVVYADGYSYMVRHMPALTSWCYDALNRTRKQPRLFDRLNTRRFVRMVQDYQPEIVVCTHFLPAEILSWVATSQGLNVVLATVLTDFDVHAMWISAQCKHYFVAADEARAQLESIGIDRNRITVSGIPIDTIFSVRKNKREMRRKHGLNEDRLTVLVPAARLGLVRLERMITSLSRLRRQSQVIVLCGRNDQLPHFVEQTIVRVPQSGAVDFKTYGFTTEVDELMTASDILVGRPGGLTTSEALAVGLVFVVVGPIPGNEKRNADYLLEEGAAICCHDLAVLDYKIERLLDNTQRFELVQKNATRLARPHAAFDVADKLLNVRRRGSPGSTQCNAEAGERGPAA
jgi:processive 1,2-diacylglycerol beta-glucosyltransferase